MLAQARAARWPSRLLGIEDLAGRLAGEEFHARLAAPGDEGGFSPADWLRALLDKALVAVSADLANGAQDWPRVWALACGLADDQTAGELTAEAGQFAGSGVTPVPVVPVPWYQPAEGSGALVARDAYGDRFLVTAPFSDPARPAAVDHWYAWDLDGCALGQVVAAGAYDSAAAARAEWQAAVGPAAATAALSPGPPELAVRLLNSAQWSSMQFTTVLGDEPAAFFREFPRLFRRADALAGYLAPQLPKRRPDATADVRDAAIEDFLDWHAGRAWNAPGAREQAEDALELILSEWGPDAPVDERAFYACSPHRIEACAVVLRDSYDPESVHEALLLLPDWVQWCARKTGLEDEFADRALTAARAEAAGPASRYRATPEREAPFRHPE